MRAYRRTSTVQQMGVSLVVFVGLMVLLDSGGLYDWASRLELGPERRVALPVATWVHRALAPLGIEKERRRGLDGAMILRRLRLRIRLLCVSRLRLRMQRRQRWCMCLLCLCLDRCGRLDRW